MTSSLRYFVPIFACLCAVYIFDGNLEGNEIDTLALALHRIDPSYIPNDFRLSMAPGPRLPFQLLLTPLLHALTLMQVSIVGRLALYAALAGAYARLARKIGLDVVEALVAGAIWIMLGSDVCTGEFVVVGVESKALAYAGVLWALDAAIDRRWARTGALLGLALTIHPAVGGWSALAMFAALRRAPAEARRRALPVFLLTAAPGIALSFPSVAHASALGTWAYVYFRHPHHLVPSCFLKWPDDVLRVFLAIALCLRSLSIDFSPAQHTLARFARATMVIFCVGLVASIFPHAEWFLYTYPFRVGDTLFPLLALMLVVRRAVPNHLPRAAKAFAVASVVALSVFTLRRAVEQSHDWAADKARPAYAWVKANTPKDALVLCAASMEYAGLYMERPTVASIKAVPTAPDDVAAWYERILDLNGGVPTIEQGFEAFDELERDFEALPPSEIQFLAAKYGASYLLWPSTGHPLPYEKIHDAGVWSVFRVRGAGSQSRRSDQVRGFRSLSISTGTL